MLLTLPRQQSVQANPITFYAPIVSVGPHLLLRAAMPVPLYLIDLRPSQLLVAPEDHREPAIAVYLYPAPAPCLTSRIASVLRRGAAQ